MSQTHSFFVAVTGAQGVGKSTFSRELASNLRAALEDDVVLLDDLGARVAAVGVPLGSASNQQTIFAVWATHLEREASAPDGLVLIDRCVVDALAYTRVLGLGSSLERQLFESVGLLASRRLQLIIHLRLSDFFRDRGASHETAEHRLQVAQQIGGILSEWNMPRLEIDADAPEAVANAVRAVLDAYRRWQVA